MTVMFSSSSPALSGSVTVTFSTPAASTVLLTSGIPMSKRTTVQLSEGTPETLIFRSELDMSSLLAATNISRDELSKHRIDRYPRATEVPGKAQLTFTVFGLEHSLAVQF